MDQVIWCPGMSLEELEKQVILKAFRFYRGNKTKTSDALGIAIRTLDAKFEKYQAQALEQEVKNAEYRRVEQEQLNRARGITSSTTTGSSPALRYESTPQVPKKREVPVSERQEIQNMSPQPTAPLSSRKAR